jgi:hypothetical protein
MIEITTSGVVAMMTNKIRAPKIDLRKSDIISNTRCVQHQTAEFERLITIRIDSASISPALVRPTHVNLTSKAGYFRCR